MHTQTHHPQHLAKQNQTQEQNKTKNKSVRKRNKKKVLKKIFQEFIGRIHNAKGKSNKISHLKHQCHDIIRTIVMPSTTPTILNVHDIECLCVDDEKREKKRDEREKRDECREKSDKREKVTREKKKKEKIKEKKR